MIPDFKKILGRRYELRETNALPGCVYYEDSVPAHHFVSVVGPIGRFGFLGLTTARDSFSELLARAILEFAAIHGENLSKDRPLAKLPGFQAPASGFDCLLVLNWQAHQAFENLDKELNLHTLELCPIFACEISGNESLQELDTIRHRGPCLIDWRRGPTPIVYILVRNNKTSVDIKRRYYTSHEYTLHEINTLPDDAESHVLVENYLGQRATVRRKGSLFCVESDKGTIEVSPNDVSDWLEHYVNE